MNKTLLTVSQVFVAINGAIFLLYGLLLFTISGETAELFAGEIITIILLAIAVVYVIIFIRLGQAKTNPEMKTEVIVWSVLLIFTSNLPAGICGILGALADSNNASTSSSDSLEKRLKELDNLYDRGLITIEEYQERRKHIIQGL